MAETMCDNFGTFNVTPIRRNFLSLTSTTATVYVLIVWYFVRGTFPLSLRNVWSSVYQLWRVLRVSFLRLCDFTT